MKNINAIAKLLGIEILKLVLHLPLYANSKKKNLIEMTMYV